MNDWFDAEQRVERAQQLSESLRWPEALAEIEAALAINPHNSSWHAQRGYILEELERPADAIAAYESALELEPDDHEVTLALGSALLRLGRVARALAIFEDLSSKHPDFEPAYCQRIAAYSELGQHELAEQMFYMAQAIDDECPHCFFHMADSLAMRGELDRAIYCWQKVLEIEPNYITVNRRIAQAYRSIGDRDLAREYLLRDLRDDPGNVDLLYELAELALESGQLAVAESKFAHICDLHEDHTEARFALGKIYLAQGRFSDSLECFSALEASGDTTRLPEFDRRIGETLFQLGRHKEANARFLQACDDDPDNPDLLMTYGTSLIGDKKLRKAEDCFRRVLATDTEHALAHHSLAVCLMQREAIEPGLKHCLEAIRLKPDAVASRCNAGVAYMRLGQWSKAREMLAKAQELDKENVYVNGLLRRMWRYRLAKIGRTIARFVRHPLG